MLTDQTLHDFAEQAAARTPTPGGGSISAAVAALGAAMGAMAARFSEGRKGAEAHAASLASEIARLDGLRGEFLVLVEQDAEAYAGLSAAYKRPKGTDAERAARRQAVAEGLRAAMEPPLRMCRLAVEGLGVLDELRAHVNPNLASDVAVGAYALGAAFRGASVNVLVNLRQVEDAELRRRVGDEGATLAEQATRLEGAITSDIIARLDPG